MTNGIGGPHPRKVAKGRGTKKAKAKGARPSLKRKGLVPAVLAKTKQV
jgi:hypothetical protein